MQYHTCHSFTEAMNKITLVYCEKPISMVDFLDKNRNIITSSLFDDKNQRNLVLHPGSNLLFIQALICFAFYLVIKEEANDENWLLSLLPKDIVIRISDNRRCEVVEVNKEKGYIRLISHSRETTPNDAKGRISQVKTELKINAVTANKYKRSYTKATSLDGRGIRKKTISEKEFLSSVFGIDKEVIPNVITSSFVVVCSKQEADFIMESTALKLEGKESIRLGELFPTAYYTSLSDSTNYAGNSASADPVIKFTNKLSIARELILEDEDKKIAGVLICGTEYFLSGVSELNDLLVRKSLNNVTMLAPITYGDYTQMLCQYEDIKLFAWTNEALLSTIEDLNSINKDNSLVDEVARLYKTIDNLCENDVSCEILETPYDKENSSICRLVLHKLKNNLPESCDKEYFITYGFGLLKLFEQACFPLSIMEELINDSYINAISPNNIFAKLESIVQAFSNQGSNYASDMRIALDALFLMQVSIQDNNPKMEYLKRQLLQLQKENITPIAIVMPKYNYCRAFVESFTNSEKLILSECDFSTAKKFNENKLYKKVFILSLPENLRFNAYTLSNAENIEFICYSFERWRLDLLRAKTADMMDYYDKKNNIKYNYLANDESWKKVCYDVGKIEDELESFIEEKTVRMSSEVLNKALQISGSTTKVSKFISFQTGEHAFFTKNYSPYVYNSIIKAVEEKDINTIEAGDILIFSKIEDGNRDIVDKILLRLIDLNQLSMQQKEFYRKSRHWKRALKEHISSNDYSYNSISRNLEQLGRKKHEVTIRSWLNEDSRIVGPRDSDSFYSIALLTNDNEMLNDPDGFCKACNEVRATRIRILKYIGKAIIHSVSGEYIDDFEKMLASIAGDIKKMTTLLQIEKIEDISATIPASLINKPHSID